MTAPAKTPLPKTLGALRASGYRPRSVRLELRDNLRRQLKDGKRLFPGVLGYDRTVIPGMVNAVLAGHDLILLGLRGQAKTRLLRSLTDFLDEHIPILAGTDLNDDPLDPISVPGRKIVAEMGDDAAVQWLPRELRYNEKLATPDVSIADLLGDIDPIKAANQKLTLADPEVIHFGLVPRTNRGIFAINEVPDLAPRIQVGLLNILEERDLQIRGFPVRIPLDILLVFSANPEDYTSRGSIITPLKDRISSQILTHYPVDALTAASITAQEAWIDRRSEAEIVIPESVRLLIEEVAITARSSELVDQTSGVSARMPIAALELLYSNLERRALLTGDSPTYPRLADLHMILPAITGKVEMVYEGEQQGAEVVAKKIIGDAVKEAFLANFPKIDRALGSGGEDDTGPYAEIVAWFAGQSEEVDEAEPDFGEDNLETGPANTVTLTDEQPFATYLSELEKVPGLLDLARRYSDDPSESGVALAAELILEGLHQHLKLAREDLDSRISYKELVKFQLLRPRRSRRPNLAEDDDTPFN